jgi:ribosomal protein L16/L10AE
MTILMFGKAIIRELDSDELLWISQKALEAAREMIRNKHYE